jgi:hypothetical protein
MRSAFTNEYFVFQMSKIEMVVIRVISKMGVLTFKKV